MGKDNSYLRDPAYQKAKGLLGKMKARELNKLNSDLAEAGLPGNATEEQKKAFRLGRDYVNNQK